ncbi:BTAD domain-containing putative transcriptional regulator [Spongiactinospora sp. 9N601]|uniref:AfsR/SARP family transcriptional regulator n=1 Tax=Spongiactinospora sp. 9N601 TaxID=3375149 RepID=UPI0037B3846F
MRLRILGPLVVSDAMGRPCGPQGPKLRTLLATLLTEHGRVVLTDRLLREHWGGRPRHTARNALQVAISELRRRLRDNGLAPAVAAIVTHPSGYLMEIDSREFDLPRFETDLVCARTAGERGELDEAAGLVARALSLWRGPALADVRGGPMLAAEACRLNELRTAAQELRFAVELRRGRSAHLIGELYALAAEHPLRERVHESLMIALHDQGRPAEALQVYSRIRLALQTQLGLEPGPGLRRIQRIVLTRGPRVRSAPSGHSPALTGRSKVS